MAMFGKCANCGSIVLGSGKDGELRFCCVQCRQFHSYPGYCEQCRAETTQEAVSGTFSLNVVFGTHLMAWGNQPCPRCHSTVRRKWFFFILPLIPVSAKYRILYQTRTRFFSRKLKIN
jgi:hypothetical protein